MKIQGGTTAEQSMKSAAQMTKKEKQKRRIEEHLQKAEAQSSHIPAELLQALGSVPDPVPNSTQLTPTKPAPNTAAQRT